jgi:hypothetical protein
MNDLVGAGGQQRHCLTIQLVRFLWDVKTDIDAHQNRRRILPFGK